MIKFITLTIDNLITDVVLGHSREVAVNVEHIVTTETLDGGTFITLSNGQQLRVKESPEEVNAKLGVLA